MTQAWWPASQHAILHLRGSTADIRKLALTLMGESLTAPKCTSSRAPLHATLLAQKKHAAWQTVASILNPAWVGPSSFYAQLNISHHHAANLKLSHPSWLQVRYGTLCCWM